MNERRQYTEEELRELPVGTIFIVHGESLDMPTIPDDEVWKVIGPNRSSLLSHSGDELETHVFDESDITITGYDASAVNHEYGDKKLRIYLNRKLDITPGKFAAHAVHAALLAFGVHPGVPVVVLEKGPTKIEEMRIHVRDAGHTELEPGTLTSGTDWPEDSHA